jgi:microtubule-associated protein-like 6
MGQDISVNVASTDGMKKYTGFSPKQVDMIKERFELMCDEDQTVDKAKFQQLLKVSAQEADKMFEYFDMDQSGRVDSYEFVCGLALLSSSKLEEKAEIIFNMYDFDRSHNISKDEFVVLLKTCMASVNNMAGKPSPTLKEMEIKATEVLNRWDTNKDGQISLKEFKSFVTKDPDILKMLVNYGLATKDDFRPDFGGSGDIPDCDSDLEDETSRKLDRHENKDMLKHGMEENLVEKEPGIFEVAEVKEGDQFMATKPWIGTVKASIPSDYKEKKGESDAPEASLELEYIYGYRCHDTRNNMRYASSGELVYHTAAVGISLNTKSNTQKFFMEHNDDVTCLHMSNDGSLVATGQVGAVPMICLWDANTMQTKLVLTGILQKGIGSVCISNDGKKLAAVALDDDHCIAIYDINTLLNPKAGSSARKSPQDGLIATGKSTKSAILDLKWDPTDTIVIAACVKEVCFISAEGSSVKVIKGSGWGKNSPPETVMCIGFIETNVITGTFKGQLLVWKGKSLANTVQGHTAACTSIYTRKNEKNKGLITGGADGLIIIWDTGYKKVGQFDIKTAPLVMSMNPKIRAVCEDSKGTIAVGTRGGEIIEFSNNQAKVVMRGHFDDELWGLAINQNGKEFATCGQDNMVAIWDTAARKVKVTAKIDNHTKACGYSPDGKYLAVGCINGWIYVTDTKSLNVINILKDRTKEVTQCKFSPKGDLLAVSAEDNEIWTYNVKQNFKVQAKLRGHISRVTHFDFSTDGSTIQSVSTSYQILYHDSATGNRQKQGATQNKDEKWASWTTTIGWPVQGIWPPCSKGSDVNSVDRCAKGDVLATADDFSKVKLFKYPCSKEKASFVKYIGHSSHVTNCRFLPTDDYLITTGGNDKAIFQWRYKFDDEGNSTAQNVHEAHDEVVSEDHGGEKSDEISPKDEAEKGKAMLFEKITEEGPGTEAMACLPFLGEVRKSVPSKFVMTKDAGDAPNANLTLKYCHGYRCFDAKNTAKYSEKNKVVFVGAALGVQMDPVTKAQTFFQMHEEDIICLAVDPKGKIAATGQMAQKGKAKLIDLYVWDIETKQVLADLKGFHLRAVCQVQFSPDGSKLLSVGQDDDNSCAVYDWAQKRLIGTSKVDKAKVTAIGWKSETEFMTCGLKHVKFFTIQGANVAGQRGQLDASLTNEAFLCAVYQTGGQTCFTGTQNGLIVPFSGKSALKPSQAHQGGVWTLYHSKTNLISGGQDGKVIKWTYDKSILTKVAEFCDMAKISKFNPGIRALDMKSDGTTMLVGTRGSELYEVEENGAKTNLLLQGHYDGELWGCSVSPNGAKYASCGGDNTLRIWDAKTFSMVAATKPLESDLRGVDWAPNGKYIVAGDCKGKIMLFNSATLQLMDSIQSSFTKDKQWIEDIKVSPDSSMVAFGAHGGVSNLEIMTITNQNKLVKKSCFPIGLTSALTHLDWSSDGTHVAVNSEAYELKFVNVQAKQNAASSGTKDFDWFTWTCLLGFPVQGIFPGPNLWEVNTACRAQSRRVLATGDDFGRINLYKYPCAVPKAKCRSFIGHSSHVTKVKFLFDDSYMISTGGNDKCVLVWETDWGKKKGVAGAVEDEPQEEEQQITNNEDNQEPADIHAEHGFLKPKKKQDKYGREAPEPVAEKPKEEGGLFQLEAAGGGDEFMAIQPWLGAIKAPTGWVKPPLNQNKAPNVDLQLEYVHGYRSKDMRNNLKYLKNGNVVYNAAALGIVLDIASNTQKFFNLHTDDITAMDVHPDGIMVATGEIGPKPVIYVWNSNTMQSVWKFKGGLEKGIANLGFSKSGDKLVGVAVDNDHRIAVFDTKIGAMLCIDKGDTAFIADVKFKNENEFVSVGPKHFKAWTFTNKAMTAIKGQFGNNNNIVGCVAFNGDDCLVGSSDGALQIWKGTNCGKAIKNHTKALDALCVTANYIITGGKDCVINVLDKSTYAIMSTYNVEQNIKTTFCGQVRSACFSADLKSILFGTYGSEIYEISTKDAKITSATKFGTPKELVKGHYTPNQQWTNEIWGLAVFKDGDRWATVSDDSTLRIWSISQKKMIKGIKLNIDDKGNELAPDQKTGDLQDAAKARSIDLSGDDKYVAIGFREGTLRIFETATLKLVKTIKDRQRWISEIKFSPDNQLMAVGSHDDVIDIYTVPTWTKKTLPKKHSSFITHLDWSTNSANLQSNCGAYELLFWNVQTGQQMTGGATALKDEQWASWTCVLGWPVQGIWMPTWKGSDINYVSRSHDKHPGGYHLLASADDFSKIRLLRYPSIVKGSEAIVGVGHSSHVTNVKFSVKDDYIFSTGGEDNCVFQWKVAPKK